MAPPIVRRLKDTLKRSKWAIVAYQVLDNRRMRRRLLRGRVDAEAGSTHRGWDVGTSVNYVRTVFEDYRSYGELTGEWLAGRRVLEIGPGDNLGVGLLFLGAGAGQVVAVDRFYSRRDERQQCEIYRQLREDLSGEARPRFDRAVSIGTDEVRFDPELLRYVYGIPVEDLPQREPGLGRFDLIVSRAVLEEIHDLDRLMTGMDRLLKPGGMMLHKVDFRDYGMFTACGMHPLTFLTIPERVYGWMTSDSPKPNRRLIDYYRDRMRILGYDSRIYVTSIVGRKEELLPHKESPVPEEDYDQETLTLMREIRRKLSPRFRNLSDSELMVSGIFLVGRKPDDGSATHSAR